MIAIINGHMLGMPTAPGEHVDWNTPDVEMAEDWASILGMSVEDYAAANPHMIVWAVMA